MLRKCTLCNSFNEFPDDYPSRRGFWCKPCQSAYQVEMARKHREVKRKNNNAYSARNSKNRSAKTAEYRANHPEKNKAHQAVQTAVRNGSLVRSPCSVCGDKIRIHAHHDDYSKPLDVIWLCHTHHMERHQMLLEREK